MVGQKNATLSVLKLLASYMVVFIHVEFYGMFGVAANTLARFAVPFFLLVSGFYSYNIQPGKIKKRIAHLLSLLLFSVVLYTAYNVFLFLAKGDLQGLTQYFHRYLTAKALLKLVFLNHPVHTTHLWYLLAALYVYILLYFATVLRVPEKPIFAVSLLLLLLHWILGEFLSAFKITIGYIMLRNFAFMGIPFFGLGMLVNKYHRKFLAVPNSVAVLCIFIGILESLLSRFFLRRNELYLGSVLILFSLVVTFTKYADKIYPPVWVTLAECSTYIYILHPFVSSVIKELYTLIHLDLNASIAMQMIHPLLVCIFSTVLAYSINICQQARWKKIITTDLE